MNGSAFPSFALFFSHVMLFSTPTEVTVNILIFKLLSQQLGVTLTVFTYQNREGFLFLFLLIEQILLLPNFFYQHLGRRTVPGSINSASLQTELLS